VTAILVLGHTSPARLHQILDAAVSRLGLSEVRVVGGSSLDAPVTAWNARRFELRRYWDAEPEADVALIFPGWDGEVPTVGRVIYVDAKASEGEG
jgi:hypothetical protein